MAISDTGLSLIKINNTDVHILLQCDRQDCCYVALTTFIECSLQLSEISVSSNLTRGRVPETKQDLVPTLKYNSVYS